MILFAVTGITLNHAAQIPATPVVKETTEEFAVRIAEAALADLAPKLRARYEADEKAEQEARRRQEEDD